MTIDIIKAGKCLIFDGAMGTMLQQAGLKAGESAESYSILRPGTVEAIHRAYVAAGAEVICTNTFQASEERLAGSGFSVEQVIETGVALARKAGAPFVAQSLGPLPGLMAPLGETSFAAAYRSYRRQVLAGVEAGSDLLLIETQSDLYQAKAAVLAAKENSSLPVLCTLTFQADGRTFLGTDPATAVHVLQGLGVDCLGANCSLGPAELLPLLAEMARHAQAPLLVQANAGLPRSVAGGTVFPVGPAEFARYGREFARHGVAAIGGCCGTTPDHIKALKAALDGAAPETVVPAPAALACSPTQTVLLGKGAIAGERLNPTGNKALQRALKDKDPGPWLSLALEQVEAGAQLLDLNVGVPGVDETELLPLLVQKLQAVIDVPLMLDSVDPAALAAAARIYNGKPVINSVNGKEDVLDQVLPVVKKYGAAVIGLTIDEQGIPESAEKRLAIAQKILSRALDLGIPKQDIVIDCLTLTAASKPEQVSETLRALPLIRERLGLATVLGVSNVSHGLPQRGRLNSVFLVQALTAGLDAAIVDPLSPEIQDVLGAWRVLSGKDLWAQDYIEKASGNKAPVPPADRDQPLSILIARGDKGGVTSTVKALLGHKSPQDIIDGIFIPALTEIGQEFEAGRLFLPQLLRSAEAVQAGLEMLKSTGAGLGPARGEVLLATVRGDIHDIGKNIVKLLLENQGFAVVDLGKDVSPSEIATTVKKRRIKLAGLSALMTTTVVNMAQTIKTLNEEAPHCKVMVGGAVLTEEYAKEIGADFYARDALAGVSIAQRLFVSGGRGYRH